MESRRPPRNTPYGQNRPGSPHKRTGGKNNNYRSYDSSDNRQDGADSRSRPSRYRGGQTGDGNRKDARPGSPRSRNWDRNTPGGRPQHSRQGRAHSRGGAGKAVQPDSSPPITSDLQITDGKLRARFLENSPSPNAAFTPRKLREITFKILARRVKARRFLDLGAGSGFMGFEAISRGAMAATFVERSARMCTVLRRNLQSLGIRDGHGDIRQSEIDPFLKQAAARRRSWDLVYLGTRNEPVDGAAFRYFGRGIPVAPGGLLMIEHDDSHEYPEKLGPLSRWRTISNGGSVVTFYERR